MSENDNVWHTIKCPYCDHKHEWYKGHDDLLGVKTLLTSVQDQIQSRHITLYMCRECDSVILTLIIDNSGAHHYEPLTKEV